MRFVFFGQGFVYFRFSDRSMFFFPFSGPRLDRDMFFWTVLCFFSAFSDRGMFFFVFQTAICFSGLGYVFFHFFRSRYVFFRFSDRGWIAICFSELDYVFLRFFGLWYVFFDWVMFISVFRTAAELQYVFLDWVMFFPLFLVCGMFFSDRS